MWSTRPTSPGCGRCCTPGSAARRCSPPTTPSSTVPSCTPVALGTGFVRPRTSFTCTVQLARTQWGIQRTSLPEGCHRLRVPLRHHDAGADARACARVVLAAEAEGWRLGRRRKPRTQRTSAASWLASQSPAQSSMGVDHAPHYAQDANTEGRATATLSTRRGLGAGQGVGSPDARSTIRSSSPTPAAGRLWPPPRRVHRGLLRGRLVG